MQEKSRETCICDLLMMYRSRKNTIMMQIGKDQQDSETNLKKTVINKLKEITRLKQSTPGLKMKSSTDRSPLTL